MSNIRTQRFIQMRNNAKYTYGVAPSMDVLARLAEELVDMHCPVCNIQMAWKGVWGERVTLQHDRSGEIRLLCMNCNARHQMYEGDTFYIYWPHYANCIRCRSLMPIDAFRRNASKNNKKQSLCATCSYVLRKAWRLKNLEYYRAWQRNYNKQKRAS